MQTYSIEELASWLHTKCFVRNVSNFEHIVLDSRTVIDAPKALFVAIRGKQHNGHDYIESMYKAGVRNFMVDAAFAEIDLYPEANFLIVENGIEGLQEIAAAKRQLFKGEVVAITGSNGKTVVKEWIAQMIEDHCHLVRSPKSYNSQVGVPLSVWQLYKEADLGIFEAGLSMPGEMVQLEKIITPTIGILTNIGAAHQENFTSRKHKLQEKMQLFKQCKTIIYCADDEMIDKEMKAVYAQKNLLSWGRSKSAAISVNKKETADREWEYQFSYNDISFSFTTSINDEASEENLLNAVTCLLSLGYNGDFIQHNVNKIVPVAMRMELKEGINNCVLVNDSYNSDIQSLALSLDFLAQQSRQKEMSRTLILSDIYQSGLSDEAICAEINHLLQKKGVTKLLAVGDILFQHQSLFKLSATFYKNTDELLSAIETVQFKNEAILVKGSRHFGFEKITALLEKKHHQTRLEVNMNALVDNLNFYRSKLTDSTKILAMVKAFSYGSGSSEIANVLQHQKVDYLGVAFADEGIELRKAGITLPIIVMNPEPKSFPSMISYHLEPEIYSFNVLRDFVMALKREAIVKYPVHIKLDTGMKRLGFDAEDIDELIRVIKSHHTIEVKSVFSHLVGSDEPLLDDFTEEQVALFQKVTHKMEVALAYPFIKHILNSAGVLRFSQYQFDMVRVGIGMYGIGVEQQSKLKPVIRFRSYISQIRQVHRSQTVGYSRKGKLDYDAEIAIVPVGYADGLNRRLGLGRGHMVVNHQPAAIVGSICMDMCMIDVTGLNAKEGDEVEVFGKEQSVIELADVLETIPYEVFAGISRRVKRVYFYE